LRFAVAADSVNPLEITRKAWRWVAENASARIAEDEIICSDKDELDILPSLL